MERETSLELSVE